jgi:hypothetical protein
MPVWARVAFRSMFLQRPFDPLALADLASPELTLLIMLIQWAFLNAVTWQSGASVFQFGLPRIRKAEFLYRTEEEDHF